MHVTMSQWPIQLTLQNTATESRLRRKIRHNEYPVYDLKKPDGKASFML